MPITRLLKESQLGPEEVERLISAYGQALYSLCLVDRNDPIAEIVAKKIIEIGATGVCDPAEISKLAVEQLGVGEPPRSKARTACSRGLFWLLRDTYQGAFPRLYESS